MLSKIDFAFSYAEESDSYVLYMYVGLCNLCHLSHFFAWEARCNFSFVFFFFLPKTYVNCIRVGVVRDDRVPSNNRHMYVKINLQFGIVEHDALCDENVTVRDLLFDLERLEFLKYQ